MGWAQENWADFNGRCLLAGINPEKIDATDLVDLCYSLLIEDLTNMETSRVEARQTVDKRIDEIVKAEMLKHNIMPEPEPFKLSAAMAVQMGIKIHQKPQG